jgi:ribonuclease BN (tRNA processing enzyme)
MRMQLVVLGGSAAGGGSGAGCSGYLVSDGESNILLDIGPCTLPVLRLHTDFRLLDGIILSHLHLDHFLDLGALRFALAYNPIPAPSRIPLWIPPGSRSWLDRFASGLALEEPDDFFSEWFEIREFDPAASITIGPMRVTFHETVHWVPCWAMRISSDSSQGDLGYTADTGPFAPLDQFFRDVRVLVAEGSDPEPHEEDEMAGHLSPSEAAALATAANAETLVLTHLWEEHGLDAQLREADRAFGGEVVLARPSTVIAW